MKLSRLIPLFLLVQIVSPPLWSAPRANPPEQIRLGPGPVERNGTVVIAWLLVTKRSGKTSLREVRVDCEKRWYTKLSEARLGERGRRQRSVHYYPEWHDIEAGSGPELEWRLLCGEVYRS